MKDLIRFIRSPDCPDGTPQISSQRRSVAGALFGARQEEVELGNTLSYALLKARNYAYTITYHERSRALPSRHRAIALG
jgi:hypothetical protein